MSPSVLVVGLDPALVNDAPSSRAAFPEVDAEVVRAGMAASQARLEELGFTTDVCLLDYGATAESVYRAALAGREYQVVVIGGGVRFDRCSRLCWRSWSTPRRSSCPARGSRSMWARPRPLRRWRGTGRRPDVLKVRTGCAVAETYSRALTPEMGHTARPSDERSWSGRRESNSHCQLGKLMFYH